MRHFFISMNIKHVISHGFYDLKLFVIVWTRMNCFLFFPMHCVSMFFELVVCFKGGLAYVADLQVELVSKELNHFGGIVSFFQDWAPVTLTGGA